MRLVSDPTKEYHIFEFIDAYHIRNELFKIGDIFRFELNRSNYNVTMSNITFDSILIAYTEDTIIFDNFSNKLYSRTVFMTELPYLLYEYDQSRVDVSTIYAINSLSGILHVDNKDINLEDYRINRAVNLTKHDLTEVTHSMDEVPSDVRVCYNCKHYINGYCNKLYQLLMIKNNIHRSPNNRFDNLELIDTSMHSMVTDSVLSTGTWNAYSSNFSIVDAFKHEATVDFLNHCDEFQSRN